MAIELIPIETPGGSSYLSVEAADALAATLPNLASFIAAVSAVKAAALELATERFDNARRYQGRKYDPTGVITGTVQQLEFPRVAYEDGAVSGQLSAVSHAGAVGQVWDWDDAADSGAGAAVVPSKVKRAVLYEANSIIAGTRDAALEAIGRGLTSQSVGGMSESYASAKDVLGGSAAFSGALCREAEMISARYALRTGRLL